MEHEVKIALIRRHFSCRYVGVHRADLIEVVSVNPESKRRPQCIIERGLTSLLAPRATALPWFQWLHREGSEIGDIIDHWVVPDLIRRLKNRNDYTVEGTDEREEPNDQPK